MIQQRLPFGESELSAYFHPLTVRWFERRFGEPTDAQRQGWPTIAAGRHTLIAAPTGSGKTLAAFLYCLDSLFRQAVAGTLQDEIQALYISPLKALSNDIHRNLEVPLAELEAEAQSAGHLPNRIRAGVRTGDTPSSMRQQMLRKPPHVLVTTPESLYLLMTSPKGRQVLRQVRTVIVDEIHALARDKRGSHLSLTLERLESICERPPVRIGLSATQRPMDEIAGFLVGERRDPATGAPDCQIIDTGHVRQLDLGVDVPQSELSAVCSNETWGEIYDRITKLVQEHRSTLIFVNTRKMSERVGHSLGALIGEDHVASHHGSLSKELRLSAEERLKRGELKAIVATASLELGIDVGYIDLVCQIGSPRSIATFLQRVGRAGHSLGLIPKGRLFPLTRDDLLECLSLVRATRTGGLDRIEIPVAPLDILAQQIVAEVACAECAEEELFTRYRRAWPYRNLAKDEFNDILEMLSNRHGRGATRGAHLHRDQVHGQLRARGARLIASTCGAIPDNADYRVVTAEEGTFVGTVNEDFAIESSAGDIFLLGNTSWRVLRVKTTEVVVEDAHGAPATIPFWLGEAPGRTIELSKEVSELRKEIARKVGDDPEESSPEYRETYRWVAEECGISEWGARQAVRYVASQKAAIGLVPSQEKIVFERFFDEMGGMQLVIHSPFGARVNRAWGLAMRKRFCRSFNFELQASADNNGIVLSLGPQHSFPLDQMFKMLNTRNAEELLKQAMLAVPMFQVRWRWNATRALAVLRQQGGKRVPPPLQRFRADDFLSSVFPASTACLENVVGDIEIPDHPLVRQTVADCLTEAMDLSRWLDILGKIEKGEVELIPRDTREPSPFSYELLNANPYAFLDDAPLEERRARAVATRRTLRVADVKDLGKLDPEAIRQVKSEAWPVVRDREEMHDTLLLLGMLPGAEAQEWLEPLRELGSKGRATELWINDRDRFWVAAERLPMIQRLFPSSEPRPALKLPSTIRTEYTIEEAATAVVRGRLECSGPVVASRLAADLCLERTKIELGLATLENEGFAIQGHFAGGEQDEVEWCERRLLSRIHRLTLDGARQQVKPVEPVDFYRFLLEHQHVAAKTRLGGKEGLRAAIQLLQGFQTSAGAWEYDILPNRITDYEPGWLDELTLYGEVAWGRLAPPKRGDDYVPSGSGMTRVVPISLLMRADLAWLLPKDRISAEEFARSKAKQVLEALAMQGALFFNDLRALTGLLPAELDDALSELAALGLVTADGFAAIRAIVSPDHRRFPSQRRKRISRHATGPVRAGRWSRFPGSAGPLFADEKVPEDRSERWAWQLLRRYGVIFRDLLTRESVAPSWGELAPLYRRLEARGEVRGGRFIAGVAGEQFALPGMVEKLREVRGQPLTGIVHYVSGADPLNLVGILGDGPKIPGTRGNMLALQDGKIIASLQGGEVRFHEPPSGVSGDELARKLKMNGMVRARDASFGDRMNGDRHAARYGRGRPR
ncbi:MAG: DEAD/DEAH box helicase [Planctomycetota bacterium]